MKRLVDWVLVTRQPYPGMKKQITIFFYAFGVLLFFWCFLAFSWLFTLCTMIEHCKNSCQGNCYCSLAQAMLLICLRPKMTFLLMCSSGVLAALLLCSHGGLATPPLLNVISILIDYFDLLALLVFGQLWLLVLVNLFRQWLLCRWDLRLFVFGVTV